MDSPKRVAPGRVGACQYRVWEPGTRVWEPKSRVRELASRVWELKRDVWELSSHQLPLNLTPDSTLWSTWSNALAKSIKTARTGTGCPSSTALFQWCIMSIKACFAVRPFIAPYWYEPNLSWILSTIHAPTNDSSNVPSTSVMVWFHS